MFYKNSLSVCKFYLVLLFYDIDFIILDKNYVNYEFVLY